MISLFLGITAVNLLCLGVAAFTGYTHSQYHILAGALAAIVSCGVHCIVITYFMATSKWIQHAVSVKHLDAQDIRTVQKVYKAEEFDFRLKPNSVAVDKGVALPNVNDGWAGRAPDLGALEVGQTLPHFGPR